MKLVTLFSTNMHVAIHQSLIKTQLFLGANKRAVYALSFVCLLPLFGVGGLFRIYKLTGFISCISILLAWLLGMALLQLVAKYDDEFFTVGIRYLKYQKYYPAITPLSFKNINSFTRRNWKK